MNEPTGTQGNAELPDALAGEPADFEWSPSSMRPPPLDPDQAAWLAAPDDVGPLHDLELRAGGLTLRPFRDYDSHALGELAFDLLEADERHFMPHFSQNAVGATPEETSRNILSWSQQRRAELEPDCWVIPFTVVLDGHVVGSQTAHTSQFPTTREVNTGSYLATSARRVGVGTAMRAMLLEFVFAHLGGLSATSAYGPGNDASRRVSEKLGYVPDGTTVDAFEGRRIEYQRVRLNRDRWEQTRPEWLDKMTVTGADAALELLGLEPHAA